MDYKSLDININFEASGSGRGYYEVDYERLKKDLDEYLSNIKIKNNKELKNLIREYINEHSFRYKGEFVFTRDDMNEEIYIEIEEK